MPYVKRGLRVGLLTTVKTNIGDDFIRDGLMEVFNRVAPGVPATFVTVNKHAPAGVYPTWHPIRLFYKHGCRPRRRLGPFRRAAERCLPNLGFSRFEKCDMIIQCGTPVLWEGCRDSEWSRLVWRDVLLRLGRKGLPVLNLGGGSCYPWERRPATLVGDSDEDFARLMLRATRLTTVRDSLAKALFATLGHQALQLCCPALLTAQVYVKPTAPSRKAVVNFMSGGGHYDWGQGIDAGEWERTMRRVLIGMERMGWQPLLLAHSHAEVALAAKIWPQLPCVHPGSPDEYFAAVRDAMFGVFNRLHASVALAGLGIPSVSVGTDSRTLMVRALGLPVFYVKEASADGILAAIDGLVRTREDESHRLLALREETLRAYAGCLRPFLQPYLGD